jgi:hypothetical protein
MYSTRPQKGFWISGSVVPVVGITEMSSQSRLSRAKISYVHDMYVCKRWFGEFGSAALSCLGVRSNTRTGSINTHTSAYN